MAEADSSSEKLRKWLSVVSDPDAHYEHEAEDDGEGGEGIRDSRYNKDTAAAVTWHGTADASSSSGPATVTFANGDYFDGELTGGVFNREGVVTRLSDCGALTHARWVDDQMDGVAVIEGARKEGVSKSVFCKGVLHGITRRFVAARHRKDNLKMVAFFRHGEARGTAWKGLLGGAFLVGPLDAEEAISGEQAIYVYPDIRTVIVGRFEGDRLVRGRMGTIVGVAFEDFVAVPSVAVDQESDVTVVRDVSTGRRISRFPLQEEPWESRHVEVGGSLLSEEAGEGLFAKVDMKRGQLVAFYNGVRLQSGRDDDSWSGYRVRLNGQVDIDIPGDMTSTSRYRASLGHKANHAFGKRVNLCWSRLEHPRFGLICSLSAARDISAGEELLVNYGVSMADAPGWYKELWVRFCREDKGMADAQIEEWCRMQYSRYGKWVTLPL